MPTDCLVNGIATLDCVPGLIKTLIEWLLGLSGSAAVFLIIFAGIKFIMSGGEAKQAEDARKTLTFAVIGLLVILLSFFVINIISTLTGVGCIQMLGFSNCL